jgi:hypothetical protein
MTYGTTLPGPMCKSSPLPACEAIDTSHNTGQPRVEVDSQRFCVRTARSRDGPSWGRRMGEAATCA